MVDTKLHEQNKIVVDNPLPAIRPAAHTGATARLVRVLAARVQLVLAVLDGVDVPVGELGALIVKAVLVRQDLLERRRVDLVRDGLAVDGIAHVRVLDLERAVRVRVEVVAAGRLDERLAREVARAVRVEVRARHGVRFVVDQAVAVALEHGVDAQGEDVLVVGGQDARVHDGAPGDVEAVVDGLRAEDAGRADFVGPFAGLVEHEGQDVLVVGNGDTGWD